MGVTVREMDFQTPPKTGNEFFNAVRDVYLRALNDPTVSDLRLFKKKQNLDDPTELSSMVMERANEGEGTINNMRTCTTIEINNSPRYPNFYIGLELAKAMGWVEMGTVNGEAQCVLRPNLRKDFPSHIVSVARDVIIPEVNGDEMFHKVTPDTLQLSAHINWVFMDLDGSYQGAFGNTR